MLACLWLNDAERNLKAAEGPLTRALKRLPAERQGPVIDMIGKRGGSSDLDYLFDQALRADGFTPALRLKALEALADSAQTRQTIPSANADQLAILIGTKETKLDPTLRLAAIRLAALWKVRSLAHSIQSIAAATETDDTLRSACLETLAALGGDEARSAIERLTAPEQPSTVRLYALAALAKLDLDAAAERSGPFLRDPGTVRDLSPMISAFLNRQGGAEKLATAIEKAHIPADPAKLALRAVFSLGHSDASIVDALSRAAGLDAAVKPLDPAAMSALVAEVSARGDAKRGENVFRRADLNCMNCHALSGAGGAIGPDLSSLGLSSPVDYVVNSIMLPDQAIKEVYQTLIVQTVDGEIFQGIVADKDDKRVVLKEAGGTVRTIATADIDASKEGGSLMPKGLVNFVTRAEFVDLVRFLSELGKAGPYAIRSTPTIQRWRFLKPVPKSLDQSIPRIEMFRSEIANSPSTNWFPAYSKLAGELPIAELTKESNSSVIYLQGEVEVSHGDQVQIKVNSPEGLTAWIDQNPATPFTGSEFLAVLATGRHKLTFRVDSSARKGGDLKVEVLKVDGSSAEYSVVGGR